MGDIEERIADAKRQAEELKSQIESLRNEKNTGGMSTATVSPKPLVQSIKTRRILKGHFGKVYALHWGGQSENGTNLVSASQDGKLIIWNALNMAKVQSIPLRSSWVMTCAFEPSSNELVACGGLDNLCSIYKLTDNPVLRATKELAAHDGYLSCCRFVTPGQIITSSGDGTCILWDVETGIATTNFMEHAGDVMSLSVKEGESNIFVSGSCDANAKVWDLRAGECTQTFHGHESDINSVQFFPDGYAFGTGSDDSHCRIFDMRSYNEVNLFENKKIICGITSVAFSASGRLLFAGYDDYNCHGWDTLINGQETSPPFALQGHENRVSCLGVNVTGESLATGSWDTLLKIWA
mmetsp:Transcript_12485/g.37503  ORF Transcript_12485/g.37503 Transcript_12485/m.37503 type:complete len:352 (-) Transcript_12485:909-1964(-)|eukprot:CAMPEP_0118867644 /NCGR_PEP_ID=MMETSP1163-20130328/11178_1 /TAXON_ID=124430 /ORGANISM="Phaeomonas parva, Strain CCMP2877" /LENGTH=351 /DNA_ID=CAMNT_0006802081 /DNA_START=117 /DNA_END=1172 /DNA_ORIENTATION=+